MSGKDAKCDRGVSVTRGYYSLLDYQLKSRLGSSIIEKWVNHFLARNHEYDFTADDIS